MLSSEVFRQRTCLFFLQIIDVCRGASPAQTGGNAAAMAAETDDIEAGIRQNTDGPGKFSHLNWVRLPEASIAICDTGIVIKAGESCIRMVPFQAKPLSSKLSEIILAITGQAIVSMVGNSALTGSYSSTEWKLLAVVIAVGFITTLISMLSQERCSSTFFKMTDIVPRNDGTVINGCEFLGVSRAKLQVMLAKLGAICVSSAVIGSMAMLLHIEEVWTWVITGVLSLIPVYAVSVAWEKASSG